MRVIITSDTHYQPDFRAALERAMHDIAAYEPECLILAGDVGETVPGFRAMLELAAVVPCPRLVLAGNHDLWTYRDASISTEALWRDLLPAAARDCGAVWLEGQTWIKDGIGICGSVAWYDYSGAEPTLNVTPQEYADSKADYWMDALMMDWARTDIAFANEVSDGLVAQVEALDADPTVRQILVVTHVPLFRECLDHSPTDDHWNYCNAYCGNLALGSRITAFPKVKTVVSGHTHVGKQVKVQGAAGPEQIDARVVPSDYGRPAFVVLDF